MKIEKKLNIEQTKGHHGPPLNTLSLRLLEVSGLRRDFKTLEFVFIQFLCNFFGGNVLRMALCNLQRL